MSFSYHQFCFFGSFLGLFSFNFRFFGVFADSILIELLIFSEIIHILLPLPVGEVSAFYAFFADLFGIEPLLLQVIPDQCE